MQSIRWQMVMEPQGEYPESPKLTGPEVVARLMKEHGHATADRERFVVYLLDTKNQIIASDLVSIGILNAALIHPREVFKAAVESLTQEVFRKGVGSSAASIIVAHNHPSGDVTPSLEDKTVAKRLSEAGAILGIPLVDFLIVNPTGGFYSFKNEGII